MNNPEQIKIKITISIPIYNCAASIANCITSALMQTYRNIEYILVDDRGNDNSLEIAKEIINQSERKNSVKYVKHESNKGCGAVRNTGIQNATGKYIFFLDSDDTIPVDAISLLAEKLHEDDYDMVAGSYIRVKTNGEIIAKCILENEIITSKEKCALAFVKHKKYPVTNWGKLYKRNIFTKHSMRFINGCHQDTPCTFELALYQNKIRLCEDIVYHYIYTKGSVSTSALKEKNYDAFKESFIKMEKIANKYKHNALYISLIGFLNNYRLFVIWQLLNKKQNISNKRMYLKTFAKPLLSFRQIIWDRRISVFEKIKHTIFILPETVRISILYIIAQKENK
ncbi:MAG: glycosyltransferase [Dysgonamonadaceae bacterium]|jgi:glycosyltransferase involved in cell wall biosynthesis|nr:glycosyltransferase [Dysgonamonadaceae bacterium]